LLEVERALGRIASSPGADVVFWAPAPLLARLAREGKTFGEYKGSAS